MVPLPKWKGTEPSQPAQERRVPNQLLETSPQRRAFSHLLRMLNSANEAKCKCEDEKQRMVPKLLRMIKQARKEKGQLAKSHELAIQTIRREMESSSKVWEVKMSDLNKSHELVLRDFRKKIDDKDTECQVLRQRCENLMDEIVLLQKKNISLETDLVQKRIECDSAVAKAEFNVKTILEEKDDVFRVELNKEKERCLQLEESHAAHIKALEETHAAEIESIGLQVRDAATKIRDKQSKDSNSSWPLIHNELMTIAENVDRHYSKRQTRSPQSTTDESFHTMEIDDTQQLQSIPAPKDEQSNKSSSSSTLSSRIAQLKTIHSEVRNDFRHELEARTSLLESKVEQATLENEQLQSVLLELRNKLAKNETENLSLEANHTKELRGLTQKMESCMQELLAEKRVNEEMQSIVEKLRREHEESKVALVRETSDQDRQIANLQEKLTKQGTELSAARDTTSKLRNQIEVLLQNHQDETIGLKNQIEVLNCDLSREKEKAKELSDQIIEIENNHRHAIEEQRKEFERMENLFLRSEPQKLAAENELSTQLLSIETANDAEVAVLKQYTRELEESIEESNALLNQAKAKQIELIEQLEKMQSHAQSLGISPFKEDVAHSPHIASPHDEEGKENLIIVQPHHEGSSPTGNGTSTGMESVKNSLGYSASSSLRYLEHGDSLLLSSARASAKQDESVTDVRRALFVSRTEETSEQVGPEGQAVEPMHEDDESLERLAVVPFSSPVAQDSLDYPMDESLEMEDWRERCYFLEHDREDLVRVTDEIIEYKKESHRLELEAAIATANREAMDRQRLIEEQTRIQMKNLYEALCSNCRQKIDSA